MKHPSLEVGRNFISFAAVLKTRRSQAVARSRLLHCLTALRVTRPKLQQPNPGNFKGLEVGGNFNSFAGKLPRKFCSKKDLRIPHLLHTLPLCQELPPMGLDRDYLNKTPSPSTELSQECSILVHSTLPRPTLSEETREGSSSSESDSSDTDDSSSSDS